MKIEGIKGSMFPKNDFFEGVFYILPKVPLTENECEIIFEALMAISEQCIEEKIAREDIGRANIIISDNGEYSFKVEDSDSKTYGYFMKNIIYAMELIRKSPNDYVFLCVFIEEIVHFIWDKLSESEVKEKVLLCVRRIDPEFTKESMIKLGISFGDYDF